MNNFSLDLSTSRLALAFDTRGDRLTLSRLGAGGAAWLHPTTPSGLFAATLNGRRWTAADLRLEQVDEAPAAAGSRHVSASLRGPGLLIEQHMQVFADEAVVELWQVIRNTGAAAMRLERVDTVALALPAQPIELLGFNSNWGVEFEPERHPLTEAVVLEARAGRSSKGHHPWFALFDAEQRVLSGAVAWSGNWAVRFEPQPDGGCALTGGLHDWEFSHDLAPGAAFTSPPVALALGDTLNQVSQSYARVGRQYWYPPNALADTLPVEWNHWWPYEDDDITEAVFADNVNRAAALGVEVCTLDAGWFGPADVGTHWEHYRGDWDRENEQRFPAGIRAVADHVHARGMKFGLWCEIEGLGLHAQVAVDHPDYVALRAGERLGYVCFGHPAVQAWAYQTLARLITHYTADWIKLDFNVDPGAGCSRTDHGHQAGDGLYAHVAGYYRTLERLRADFPAVLLENCSSGGLRADLGLLRRTDTTYVSDTDWPEHGLQTFWGASTMLAADRLLHWTFSEWRPTTPPPKQIFDPNAPSLTPKRWEYYARISMLGGFGLSQKLPTLPAWLTQRVGQQIKLYQEQVRRFVKQADLYRLTDQPRRSGEGERWAAFQYSLPDKAEHLLFVFRLPGAEAERAIRLQGLEPERLYTITGLEGEVAPRRQLTGQALMEHGLVFTELLEEDSALFKLT